MSEDRNDHDTAEDRVDELARTAGAALRRPAPADGVNRVRAARRRRTVARTVAAGSAVALIGIGIVAVVDPDGDDATTIVDSVPATVTTAPAPPSTTPATSTTPTSTTPTSTTAAPPGGSGWRPATREEFPVLAYIPCCGTNWEGGEPSPAVPADASDPLAPGTYHVQATEADPPGDGVLTLEVRPYTRCGDLDEWICGADPPPRPDELGVPQEPARTIDVVLDESVGVGVFGQSCAADELLPDLQAGTGVELTALFAELDAAYEVAVGRPLRDGIDPARIAADLDANGTAGFVATGCSSYPYYAWVPSTGPTILTSLGPELIADPTLVPPPEPLESAAADWIRPTSLEVDEQGGISLFFYAGFLS